MQTCMHAGVLNVGQYLRGLQGGIGSRTQGYHECITGIRKVDLNSRAVLKVRSGLWVGSGLGEGCHASAAPPRCHMNSDAVRKAWDPTRPVLSSHGPAPQRQGMYCEGRCNQGCCPHTTL